MDGWVLPDTVRDAPAYTPRPFELADAELLLSGAYAPLVGFLGRADLATVAARGRLADGSRWPVPVTLEVPIGIAADLDPSDPDRRALLLTEPPGAPVAAVAVGEVWQVREGVHGVAGLVRRVGTGPRGAFHALKLSPADVSRMLPPGRVLGIFADRPLHRPQLAQLALAARTLAGSVVVLVPVGAPTPDGLPPEALVRAVLAARDRMPPATIVPVPMATRGDEIRDGLLRGAVASAYGVTHLLATGEQALSGGGPRVMIPRELAYDARDGQWRGREDIPPRNRRAALSPAEIHDMLDRGTALPEWHTPPAVARELDRDFPPRRERGVVVFFTGLPGSGKSTIARGVADVLAETGERTVTTLDGQIAHRELSVGPITTREGRNRDIRRVGWVAAEAARHGGLVLCALVAPYARARNAARVLARAAGAGFILVHVDAPPEVCRERNRSIRTPGRGGAAAETDALPGDESYEVPEHPDLVVDTSRTTVTGSVETVIDHLAGNGWIDPVRPS